MSDDNSIRLAKRLAESIPCSRAEAEKYIAGGWVLVDGVTVEEPGARVLDTQEVTLHEDATLEEAPPVTILYHKPAGVDAEAAIATLSADNLQPPTHGRQRFLKRHLAKLTLVTPLDIKASGLVVYSQDFRITRKLLEEAKRIEEEFVVEVAGTIREGGLALLNEGLSFNGKPLPPMKASWQNETRLRFAGKGIKPGQLLHMCRMVGLSIVSTRRLRVGRVPMAGLPSGQWRYLQDVERF
jgi:23S rRNA pseudouridine2604 synthase